MRAALVPHLVLTGCLLVALALSVHGLVRALTNRVPLRYILGARWWAIAIALAVSVALCTAAAWRAIAGLRSRRRDAVAERQYGSRTSLAFLRKIFCVSVATWVVFLRAAQPFQRIHFDLAVGVAAGVFAALIAAEPLFERTSSRARRVIDIVAFNLCLTLVGGELALRGLAAWKPSALLARVSNSPTQFLEQNRCRPGQIRFGFPCNSGGHYDEEFRRKRPGERLVLTIGDSFSIGIVPHAVHFTTVCERELGVPVDNMGVAGTNPPEYLAMLMQEALPLDPDVMVIDVFVGNDIIFPTVRGKRSDALLRSWFDQDYVLLCVVPGRIARLQHEMRSRTNGERPVGTVQGERSSESDAGAPSTGRGAFDDAERAAIKRYPWIANPLMESETFSEETFLSIESVRATQVCTESPTSYEQFFETFSDIQRAAGETPLYVMLIPDEFQVEDSVWRGASAKIPGPELERDRPQRILLPWFEKIGVPCLDLLPVLRGVEPLADGKRHVYHLHDTHFNARGNRVAGEALAKFLRPRLAALSLSRPSNASTQEVAPRDPNAARESPRR